MQQTAKADVKAPTSKVGSVRTSDIDTMHGKGSPRAQATFISAP